ncbi:MAG: hypothetical protein JXB43_09115 [Dehalococcoidia bacterium]|nr:hypothetical protein [Dehalococcoidia bacterium]
MNKNKHEYIYILTILLLGALIIWASGCATKPPEQSMPAIYSFTAIPAEINPDQWTTLEWNTSGTTSATIQPEVGSVGPSGSLKLSPDQTTTYELIATNEAGSTTASVTVTVIPVVTGKPDLVITDIFGYDGQTLYYRIKNQGNADAKPSKTHFYVWGTTDYNYKRPRAVDWVDSLTAGEEIATTFPNLDLTYDRGGFRVRVPAADPYDVEIFKICADVDNEVDESNEDNNCLEGSGL